MIIELESKTYKPSINGWELTNSVIKRITPIVYHELSKKSQDAEKMGIIELIRYEITPYGNLPIEKRICSSKNKNMIVNKFTIV
jgi:hypothetical protein